jgi:uncharacterized protein YyaL (SSP411 family)
MRLLLILVILPLIMAPSCGPQSDNSMLQKHTNRLIEESSPYLLQHAHNPVDWYPWGDEAFEKARLENKLVLISIGYSACHWCHVMEHESFEDDSVAAVMNKHFISIKVDREERPDIDQVYMNAVQLMTGSGGWPLNCFALPDGRPVYGGTYFQKKQWINILESLQETWKLEPAKFEEYASRLTTGVQQSELIHLVPENTPFSKDTLNLTVEKWKTSFDNREGGPNRAPKFMLPNNYQFLMHYATLTDDTQIEEHVKLTLQKMAFGGIYDQAGGGFSRYSVDMLWKVPHFEKMLYDNAQMLSLYSEAFQKWADPLFKHTVYQTIDWLEREMTDESGAFYSALDADSEGEEGKFYVWKKEELQALFGAEFEFVKDLYSVDQNGLWEHGNYILLRNKSDEELMKMHALSPNELGEKKSAINQKILEERSKRVRPGLDDKTLTSWNALMITGLCDAYAAFGETRFLKLALKNAEFILKHQKHSDGRLNHSYKAGKSNINGYLEDYSFTIEAFIQLYQNTFDEKWLNEADLLTEYAIQHFYDEKSGMFWFTSNIDPPLIARKTEINDNVIPASNSSMAKALFKLGHIKFNTDYLAKSEQMLRNVQPHISSYGSGYSNWAQLLLFKTFPFYEIVITGAEAPILGAQISEAYLPNKIILGAVNQSSLSLFENRFFENQSTIFVCVDNACQMPVNSAEEALQQIK